MGKRSLVVLISGLVLVLALTACSSKPSQVYVPYLDYASTTSDTSNNNSDTSKTSSDVGDILDISSMSNTMAYAQVANMISNPDEYVGKTVKITGTFSKYTDETLGNTYYGVLIYDETACCSYGLEFYMEDEKRLENLNEGDMITVEGVYDTYEEQGQSYAALFNAEFK